jgi:hypothetical protein
MAAQHTAGPAYRVGDKLECFDAGLWLPCIIQQIAPYVGKSGPGYYATYDPRDPSCGTFWVNDRMLRARTAAGPYRAEHGAIHHSDMGPGFIFTVDPPAFAEDVAEALNVRAALRLAASINPKLEA